MIWCNMHILNKRQQFKDIQEWYFGTVYKKHWHIYTNMKNTHRRLLLLVMHGNIITDDKWRWPNFSGLTIFEFINHYKVTFFSARTCPNFPTSLANLNMFASLRFRVRERPEKYFLLSAWGRELYVPGPQFFIIS